MPKSDKYHYIIHGTAFDTDPSEPRAGRNYFYQRDDRPFVSHCLEVFADGSTASFLWDTARSSWIEFYRNSQHTL